MRRALRVHPLAACGIAALVGGCVSVQQIPLAPDGRAALQNREITLGLRDKPDFAAWTPGVAALGGGLIAGAIIISNGNRLVAENQIDDPSLLIERALSRNLSTAYGARLADRTAHLSDDDVAQATREHSSADLIVDVRTINWSLLYFPTDWTHYRVIYSARLRVIDVKRSRVIAEGSCKRIPGEAAGAPTYDELVTNGAARLKQELNLAAQLCIDTFSRNTLAIANPVTQVAAAAPSIVATQVPPSGETPPSTAAPTTRTVAFASAPATVKAASDGFPQTGSAWTYTFRDRFFPNRNRDFSVRVTSIDGSNITEVLASGNNQEKSLFNVRDLKFYARQVSGEPLIELSPYLLAHLQPPLTPFDVGGGYAVDGQPANWKLRVTGITRERVSVPAGSFDAFRVALVGQNRDTSIRLPYAANEAYPRRFEYTVWYTPEIGRYVQIHHKTLNMSGREISDEWVQLIRFDAGGAATPDR